ncbi:hypothetical protein MPSEU_000807900 [Mayamaea pseudoterrestris]|nr:hypothetical protein MPSEU_000807900 [Mayamaea pseudoterrestris]
MKRSTRRTIASVTAATFLVAFNFTMINAMDIQKPPKRALRRLQTCYINGISYCQPSELNVSASPVASPTTAAPVPVPTYPSPVNVPSTFFPTPYPVTTTPSPVTPSPTASIDTFSPSDSPTLMPTLVPTAYPTFSPVPSKSPSAFPSKHPSSIPTAAPTATPTGTPTSSAAPSMDPDGFDTTIRVGDDGLPKAVSTCRNEIPAKATNVTNQLVSFDYVLNVAPGSSAQLSMSTITMRLHNALTEQFLDCLFDGNSDTFYTARISTNPGDAPSNVTCSSDQRFESNECYIVNGGFTVQTFYLQSQDGRRLGVDSDSSVVHDKAVLDSFSASLANIFDSGLFDTPPIASTTFLGVTNSAVVVSDSAAKVIAGSVFGSLLVIGLICGVLFLAGRGLKRRRQYTEELKDQYSLSLYEDRSQTASVDNSPRVDLEGDSELANSIIISDNDSLTQMERLEVIPGASMSPKRHMRPPQPAMEDDELDAIVARTMLSHVRRDLGPRTAPASPRRYDIQDTVDL